MSIDISTKNNIDYQLKTELYNIPPGQLQYKITKECIINLNINNYKNSNVNYKTNYELESHSKENLKRLIPNTKTGKKGNWKLLLVIKKYEKNNMQELKAALINTNTNEIALMSSLNKEYSEIYKHRTVKSNDENWRICHAKMIAPLFFWEELKNRILY